MEAADQLVQLLATRYDKRVDRPTLEVMMRVLVLSLLVLFGSREVARAEDAPDPRAEMREAAIGQADTVPAAIQANGTVKDRANGAEGRTAAQNATAAAHQAGVKAASEAARAIGATVAELAPGPARGAAARSVAQNANQRGAAAASQAHATVANKPGGPPQTKPGGRP